MEYESTRTLQSASYPDVRFTITRMSFGRRLALTREVRELARKLEFLQAGDSAIDRLDATISSIEAEQLYVRWALTKIEGIQIDGTVPDVETLIAAGPEDLCKEIAEAVRHECGLTDDERKN